MPITPIIVAHDRGGLGIKSDSIKFPSGGRVNFGGAARDLDPSIGESTECLVDLDDTSAV